MSLTENEYLLIIGDLYVRGRLLEAELERMESEQKEAKQEDQAEEDGESQG